MMFNDVGHIIANSDIIFGDTNLPEDHPLVPAIVSTFYELSPNQKFAIAQKYEKALRYIAEIRLALGDETSQIEQEIKNLRYAIKPHKSRLKGNAGLPVQLEKKVESWA